jgi:hypothetical protein
MTANLLLLTMRLHVSNVLTAIGMVAYQVSDCVGSVLTGLFLY